MRIDDLMPTKLYEINILALDKNGNKVSDISNETKTLMVYVDELFVEKATTPLLTTEEEDLYTVDEFDINYDPQNPPPKVEAVEKQYEYPIYEANKTALIPFTPNITIKTELNTNQINTFKKFFLSRYEKYETGIPKSLSLTFRNISDKDKFFLDEEFCEFIVQRFNEIYINGGSGEVVLSLHKLKSLNDTIELDNLKILATGKTNLSVKKKISLENCIISKQINDNSKNFTITFLTSEGLSFVNTKFEQYVGIICGPSADVLSAEAFKNNNITINGLYIEDKAVRELNKGYALFYINQFNECNIINCKMSNYRLDNTIFDINGVPTINIHDYEYNTEEKENVPAINFVMTKPKELNIENITVNYVDSSMETIIRSGRNIINSAIDIKKHSFIKVYQLQAIARITIMNSSFLNVIPVVVDKDVIFGKFTIVNTNILHKEKLEVMNGNPQSISILNSLIKSEKSIFINGGEYNISETSLISSDESVTISSKDENTFISNTVVECRKGKFAFISGRKISSFFNELKVFSNDFFIDVLEPKKIKSVRNKKPRNEYDSEYVEIGEIDDPKDTLSNSITFDNVSIESDRTVTAKNINRLDINNSVIYGQNINFDKINFGNFLNGTIVCRKNVESINFNKCKFENNLMFYLYNFKINDSSKLNIEDSFGEVKFIIYNQYPESTKKLQLSTSVKNCYYGGNQLKIIFDSNESKENNGKTVVNFKSDNNRKLTIFSESENVIIVPSKESKDWNRFKRHKGFYDDDPELVTYY